MKRSTLSAVLVIIIIILIGGLYLTYAHRGGSLFSSSKIEKDSGSNISDYSAIFLTNGQVYFGKIVSRTDQELDIQDIYYLQVNQNIQQADQTTSSKATPTPSPSPQVSLVKLGNELHGPNDRMRINISQVLFTESLKSDSKVVKAIQDYTSK